MRISADKNDAGYTPLATAPGVEVYFNGQPRRDCVTADEERSMIVTYIRDEEGRLVTDNAGNLIKRTVRGKVEIIFPYKNWLQSP